MYDTNALSNPDKAYNPPSTGGGLNQTAPPPSPLMIQDDALAALEFSVKMLEDRLKPVLRPDFDSDKVEAAESEQPAETAIYRTTGRIRRSERRVNKILDRLEV